MSTHTCPNCDSPGDGKCSACHGAGKYLENHIPGAVDVLSQESSCTACGGTGECQACDGMGEMEVGGEAG